MELSFKNLREQDVDDHFENEYTDQVQWIYLACNLLKRIPSSVLLSQNLRGLSLSGNEIEKIPAKLCTLKKLEHLNLSDNKIETLPSSLISLENLRILNLTNNRMAHPFYHLDSTNKEKTQELLQKIYEYFNPIERSREAALCFMFCFKHSETLKSISRDICLLISKLIYQSRKEPQIWEKRS